MSGLSASKYGALFWWRALCLLATVNVCVWIALWQFGPRAGAYSGIQLALSGVYVFVCAYRSILPRVDLERRVMVDSFFSSIFLGRAAATVAEICFGTQLGLLVYQLGAHAGLLWVQQWAWVVTVCTILAQAFCWHSILTLNHITQAVESLLWGLGFSWMAAMLAVIAMDTNGIVHQLAIVGAAASAAFVIYVVAVDIPLYLRRFRAGRAGGCRYLSVGQGVLDAWRRREPELGWDKWRDDAAWLTPYFSLGVWCSMALVVLPLLL